MTENGSATAVAAGVAPTVDTRAATLPQQEILQRNEQSETPPVMFLQTVGRRMISEELAKRPDQSTDPTEEEFAQNHTLRIGAEVNFISFFADGTVQQSAVDQALPLTTRLLNASEPPRNCKVVGADGGNRFVMVQEVDDQGVGVGAPKRIGVADLLEETRQGLLKDIAANPTAMSNAGINPELQAFVVSYLGTPDTPERSTVDQTKFKLEVARRNAAVTSLPAEQQAIVAAALTKIANSDDPAIVAAVMTEVGATNLDAAQSLGKYIQEAQASATTTVPGEKGKMGVVPREVMEKAGESVGFLTGNEVRTFINELINNRYPGYDIAKLMALPPGEIGKLDPKIQTALREARRFADTDVLTAAEASSFFQYMGLDISSGGLDAYTARTETDLKAKHITPEQAEKRKRLTEGLRRTVGPLVGQAESWDVQTIMRSYYKNIQQGNLNTSDTQNPLLDPETQSLITQILSDEGLTQEQKDRVAQFMDVGQALAALLMLLGYFGIQTAAPAQH